MKRSRRTTVPMEVVADTNVFIAVALDEPEKTNLIRITSGCDLIAPEVLPFEIGNALTAWMRNRLLDRDEILAAWTAVQAIPVKLRALEIEAALRIASQLEIYAYDAYVIECALASRSPLLTLDRRLKAIAGDFGVEILFAPRSLSTGPIPY